MEFEKLTELIIELEVDDIQEAVREALGEDKDPFEVLNALTKGMDEVGRRYEEKEYYLTELVLAGETMKEAFEVLQPALADADQSQEKTKIILATVKGDNHDIGKNILGSLLLSSGFEIHDLGMDVDETKIVEKVKETGASIVALSSLLTMTVEQIKIVDKALKNAGLRDQVKLIVGGAPLNEDLAKELGADDFAEDAVEGVKHIKALAEN
ncbi:MAG: Dimethylamine corrinoid protein [Promethearchaeota archaeon]|jgi:methylmalonyl-CoA mutase cobalamin-binding domain/chain|nr:MAG: Dimethylamine corrinoid protein [Candidatus Lokiarchaeota archaeon]